MTLCKNDFHFINKINSLTVLLVPSLLKMVL